MEGIANALCLPYTTQKAEPRQPQPIISNSLEADIDRLLNVLRFFKKLLTNVQTSMIEKKANLKNIMNKFVDCLGLSLYDNQ